MNKNIIFLLAILVLCSCESKVSKQTEASIVESQESSDVSESPKAQASLSLPSEADYVCQRADKNCLSSVFGAKTSAEAAWLRINGYPTEEESKYLSGLSPDQLRRKADSGSLPAMVIYGEYLSKSGDTKQGLGYIYSAIKRGSIFGYYGMSEAFQKSPGLQDRVDAAAYLRVAYLLGDSKAAIELHKNFDNLSAIELASIDRRALDLYKSLAKSRPANPRP